MKRYILAGIILFFVLSGIVILNPAKPQHHASDNKPASYEYYYNENEEEEEDSLLPEDLSSILSDTRSVPLDTTPSSKTVLVNRVYLLPSDYIPPNLVVPDVKFSFTYSSDKRNYTVFPDTAPMPARKRFTTKILLPGDRPLPMLCPPNPEAASTRPG